MCLRGSSAVSHGPSLYLNNNQLHCFKLKRLADKVSGGKKIPMKTQTKYRKKRSRSTSQKINPLAQAKVVFLICKVVRQKIFSFNSKPALFCLLSLAAKHLNHIKTAMNTLWFAKCHTTGKNKSPKALVLSIYCHSWFSLCLFLIKKFISFICLLY